MTASPSPEKPFAGQLAVVTGASRGIGAAVAETLAAAGAHVVAVGRTVGALEELDDRIQAAGGTATLVPLDLKESAAVEQLGGALYSRWGKLDILVAGAATLGDLSPVAQSDPKTWAEVMAVNLTANYHLIRTLDPILRAATGARALFVTDKVASVPTAYWNAYAVSKAGLGMLVEMYAAETKATGLRVMLHDPGPAATALRAVAYPGEKPDSLPSPASAADGIVRRLLPVQ